MGKQWNSNVIKFESAHRDFAFDERMELCKIASLSVRYECVMPRVNTCHRYISSTQLFTQNIFNPIQPNESTDWALKISRFHNENLSSSDVDSVLKQFFFVLADIQSNRTIAYGSPLAWLAPRSDEHVWQRETLYQLFTPQWFRLSHQNYNGNKIEYKIRNRFFFTSSDCVWALCVHK